MIEQTHKTCCPSFPSTSGRNDSGGGTLELKIAALSLCAWPHACYRSAPKTSVRLCMCSVCEPQKQRMFSSHVSTENDYTVR